MSDLPISAPDLQPLAGLLPEELSSWFQSLGEKAFRGRQLFEAIHRQTITSLDDATTLSKTLRSSLVQAGATVHALTETAHARSADGTQKLAYSTHDGRLIETVLIPMESGSYTQCISSQAGCPLDCAFCMTGHLGYHRNLTAAEIVDQHLLALPHAGQMPIKNLVFMGMGEPLLNLDQVIKAIRLLHHEAGRNISHRRITVSTAGVVPGIERLAKEAPVYLAISLNAPNQELRARLMPISRKYPLSLLLETLKSWPLRPHQRLTFEYVLLSGINDSVEQAKELVRLLAHHRAKVNLIPFNPHPGSPFIRPSAEQVDRFAAVLQSKHMTVTVRQSRGQDIDAACGQLAGALVGANEIDEDDEP